MRAAFALLALLSLPACAYAPSGQGLPGYQPRPGQGQYVRPDWLNPAPTPRLPAIDPCQSRTYAALLGQNEGAIWIPALPGRKRILRPAFDEGFGDDFLGGELEEPTFVEVTQYLPGQQLYAPDIATVTEAINLGPEDVSRLTIELDREGYVQEIRCG